MKQMIPSPLVNFTMILLVIAILISLLYWGRNFLIPLTVAIVIWYLIISLSSFIQRTPFIGKHLSDSVSLFFALLFCFGMIWAIVNLIRTNITAIVTLAPIYQAKLELLSEQIFHYLGVDKPPKLSMTFKELNFNQMATGFAQTATDIASSTGIIIVYVIFLLIEHHSFDQKLQALIPDLRKLENAKQLIHKIAKQVQSYVVIKIFTSLLTAICSFIVMTSVGVDFADFWAFMIFLLNFIPTIGAIIATIFPCILALIQFDTLSSFLIVAISLTSIQFFVGNILEPRLMGRSFNLSSFIIILSLAFWGQMWGITGMFFCVPIIVIANIILENFPKTRPVAILLSETGNLR